MEIKFVAWQPILIKLLNVWASVIIRIEVHTGNFVLYLLFGEILQLLVWHVTINFVAEYYIYSSSREGLSVQFTA